MYIDDIKIASPFRDLFPIRKRTLENIMWDMRKNGYDKSQPLVLWDGHGNIVIDGHTRLAAARKAEIYQIPVIFKDFTDEDEALKYAIACQKNRRNLSDSELVACVVELDKRKQAGRPRQDENKLAPHGANYGKSAHETAELLGVNHRKVERIRTVMDNAPDDIKQMVKTGRMTVNSAYNRTVGARSFKISTKVLDEFCALTIKRFDRGQLRYIADVLNKELSKSKEDANEPA